eukprot:CAMPEP_0184653528 /NCGR_PEP_ID=MMETSP0308-20130426/11249_1 /TAXON_ID=38269 /ORGANISM="Gloeochaete witrockiana, Strain SAG 46.84" /LENGTH=92 /DNA_ID=CAMNT_0027089033 /DNA_START=369 /DNA_END=647 /DNA_ORIENTATION=+
MARTWENSQYWSTQLNAEYNRQGDLEKEHGLPVSPFCKAQTPRDQAKGQVTFLLNVGTPLYQLLSSLFPELSPFYENLQSNLKRWRELADAP